MQQGAVLAMLAKELAITDTSCGPGCGRRWARSGTR